MKVSDIKKAIKKAYPDLVFRYTYISDGLGTLLVYRGKNYEHYEFNMLGEIVVFEE